MRLDKAIELLGLVTHGETVPLDKDLYDAIGIAREALIFIRLCREHDFEKVPERLHGETQD